MSQPSLRRKRVEPSSLTGLLLAGDLLAIGLFAVVGGLSHGYSITADPGRFLGTFAQFLVAWVLVAVAGSLYTERAVDSLRNAVLWTVAAWAPAVVIAQALRWTETFPGNPAVTFALVSFGVCGTLLVCWRSLVAVAR